MQLKHSDNSLFVCGRGVRGLGEEQKDLPIWKSVFSVQKLHQLRILLG